MTDQPKSKQSWTEDNQVELGQIPGYFYVPSYEVIKLERALKDCVEALKEAREFMAFDATEEELLKVESALKKSGDLNL